MTDVMKPIANDSDSPSFVQPDAIHPQTGKTPVNGAAPWPDHPDARLARLASAVTDGEQTIAHDASNPAVLESRAAAAFLSSTQLSTGTEE